MALFKSKMMIASGILTLLLAGCQSGGETEDQTQQDSKVEENTEQKAQEEEHNMHEMHSSSGEVPEGLQEAEDPKFPGKHPLFMGMPGMHGTYAANQALLECDLLIGIGARFDDRVTMGRVDKFARKAKIVHIDVDPAEIGKTVETYIPLVGDVKLVL